MFKKEKLRFYRGLQYVTLLFFYFFFFLTFLVSCVVKSDFLVSPLETSRCEFSKIVHDFTICEFNAVLLVILCSMVPRAQAEPIDS